MDEQSESLSSFLQRLWLHRRPVATGALLGGLLGVLLVVSIRPHYRATMIVAPAVAQETRDTLLRFEQGAQIPRYFGMSDPVSLEFTRFEQILREGTVAGILSRYDGVLEKIGQDRVFRVGRDLPLRKENLTEYLNRRVTIAPLGVTTSRRISYEHPNPEFAVQLLKHLHRIADTTIRHRAIAETGERISWLQKELTQSRNPDHRAALADLLMVQERRRMLASMDHAFAAEMVESPSVSPRPVWPQRSVVMLVTILVGALAGFLFAVMRRNAEDFHP